MIMKRYLRKLSATSAITLAALGFSAGSAFGAAGLIKNDAWMRSTDGQPIFASSGYLAKFGDTYYLYGQEYVASAKYYRDGTVGGSGFVSTNVYTSTDLINWTPKVVAWDGGTYVTGDDWAGRCWGVLYNAPTNRYVMWMKYQGANGGGGLCLTSTSPLGPFKVDHLQTTVGNIFSTPARPGDSKFFYAADGKPYLACSDSHGRQRAYVASLSSDYKTVNPVTQIALWPEGQEGNTALYVPSTDRYYYFSSETNGWSFSHAFVVTSTSLMSGYGGRIILPGTDATNSYWSQTVQATSISGTTGTVHMMLCDRWALFSSNYKNAGHGIGFNVWEPLTISGSSVTFHPLASWYLDAAAGVWQPTAPTTPPPSTGATYQAESAVLAGGATSESSSTGFHGAGYANFPASGGTVTFDHVAGNGGGMKTLIIRYANGGTATRTGNLIVNGASKGISFPVTGAWTTWATLSVTIALNNNTSNTIQFASTGNDLANLDEITVP